MPQASPVPRAAARPDYCDNAIGRYIGVVLGGQAADVVRIDKPSRICLVP
jgi:hypothetical protein